MAHVLHVVTIVLATVYTVTADDSSVCYFPIEYQGTFLIQTQASPTQGGNVVSYSEITLEADSIPPWGRCHKRRGNNVILKDSTGPEDCMRCFHITLKSPNVIQIHAEGLARCYTNEDAARATCPSEKDVRERKFTEILLFRKHVPGGLQSVEHRFCPFNGRFQFSYMTQSKEFRCEGEQSELSNCPHGNALGVKFRQCTFPNMDMHFLCLGDWDSNTSGDRYVALMDLREDPEARPKYRCGLYREDAATGKVFVSLSSDSTCLTNLKSATSGFETLVLTPRAVRGPPPQVEASKCRFPDWTQAKWERAKIDGNSFIFRDEANHYQTLTSKCVMRQNNTPNDRFIVYSVSQCGDETYNCVWFKRRSPNILEFQFGGESSSNFSEHLCDDKQFTSNAWVTQGRKVMAGSTPCPITGDYTGPVPGTTGLCAKVASDCNNPDIMFYSVMSCENRSHVFEEREYRCLGNWEEDSILYTYTQRRDMPGHQCFAGKIYKSGEEAFIKEAGDSCVRGEDPLLFGMKITKQASCPRLSPVTAYVPMRPNWPPKPEKVHPHKMPYPLRPYPPQAPATSGASQSLRPPAPRPASTRDPYWYQAEAAATKPWKPVPTRPLSPPPQASGARTPRLGIDAAAAWLLSLAAALVFSQLFTTRPECGRRR